MSCKTLKKYQNEPIIFLHGFLGSAEDFNPLFSYLKDFNCIAIDLPGHHFKNFEKQIYIPFEKFHLVGYSMGGSIALQFQKTFPEKVLSLHLLSTHPGLKTITEKKQRALEENMWMNILIHEGMDVFLQKWYARPLFAPFIPDLKIRKEHNISDLIKAYRHFCLSKQKFFNIDNVLVGERDEKFIKLFKNPVIIKNAAHAVHLENPKEVSKVLIKRFLHV